MLSGIFIILSLLKFKFSKNETAIEYLRRKYDATAIHNYRKLESTAQKLRKAQLDITFLLTCKMNNTVPNFVKFKLYRKSLYNSQFYHEATCNLLDNEIKFKEKVSKRLGDRVSALNSNLKTSLSYLDVIFIHSQLSSSVNTYSNKVVEVHNRKLIKLGVNKPNFKFMDQVIFNYSSVSLSKKEKFLLSLGLDFCLPTAKPKFVTFFLSFEKLAHILSRYGINDNFNSFRKECSYLAHKVFTSHWGHNWFPFLKKEDIFTLKRLGNNKNLVVTKPDKGNGVVILDKSDYNNKMCNILEDISKFQLIDCDNWFKLIFKIEDRINRFLATLKTNKTISDSTYDDLYVSGSSFGTLYGSPKVHKGPSVPLRPILAAYNLPNYKLAKFLVPLLSHLTDNAHSIKNSFTFSQFITQQNSNSHLVSYDVESLFTNIPVSETIDIIISKLFPSSDAIYCGFSRTEFATLLKLAVCDTHFIFNDQIYKQTEGMAMGSPLGPTFANIFMNFLETNFLQNCDTDCQPIFYKRYVDDTLVAFQNLNQAQRFLQYINQQHPNINFTMEVENNNCINFLDITISRSDNSFTTNIFRKNCFTGLGQNFYSFSPVIYKYNSCKTLIHRAFSICSNWKNFTSELSFLKNFFKLNCFPNYIFDKCVKTHLDAIFLPKPVVATVPKCIHYISFPYLGSKTKSVQQNITKLIAKYYSFLNIKLAFSNPYKISSFFLFKDRLAPHMRSNVVYIYNCPKCSLGRYIGCTTRLLRVRICGHMGISHRTHADLGTQVNSSVHRHAMTCKSNLTFDNFKLLYTSNSKHSLYIAESLLIKQMAPPLNVDQSSIPLYVT